MRGKDAARRAGIARAIAPITTDSGLTIPAWTNRQHGALTGEELSHALYSARQAAQEATGPQAYAERARGGKPGARRGNPRPRDSLPEPVKEKQLAAGQKEAGEETPMQRLQRTMEELSANRRKRTEDDEQSRNHAVSRTNMPGRNTGDPAIHQ